MVWVRRGLYATIMIAIGALSPAYLPRVSWLYQVAAEHGLAGVFAKTVGTLITMAGALLLIYSWFQLRPKPADDEDDTPLSRVRVPKWVDRLLRIEPVRRPSKHDSDRNVLNRVTSAGPRPDDGSVHPEDSRVGYQPWAVLLIWALPLLLAPPVFSQDAYSYAAQGWLVYNHLNPYNVGPAYLPGQFADQVAWVWRMTPAPYGPLSLQIQNLIVELCGFRPYLSAWMMRIPALIGVGLLGYYLPRIAHQVRMDATKVAWFAVLNPLVLINYVGGEHNDALMMGLMVMGLWMAHWAGPRVLPGNRLWAVLNGWWWIGGAVVVGVAASIKQPAVMALIALPLIARAWKSWKRREVGITVARILLSFAVGCGTFALITWATGLGFGWINAVNVPGMVFTVAPFTLIGKVIQLILEAFGMPVATAAIAMTISRSLGMVFAGVIIVLLFLRLAGRRPLAFLSGGFLAAALCGPALHSWYVQWGSTLLPLTGNNVRLERALIWGTAVMLAFDSTNMSIRNDALAIGVAAIVGLAVIVFRYTRMARLQMGTPQPAETGQGEQG